MVDSRRVFVLQPFAALSGSVYRAIKEAVALVQQDATVFRIDDVPSKENTLYERIEQAIDSANLVICDMSGHNPYVMYELGQVHEKRKPVIVIAQTSEHIPFDVKGIQALIYDDPSDSQFLRRLGKLVSLALAEPSGFTNLGATKPDSNNVFISYCHRDNTFLDRLMVHLRPLEKEYVTI